MAKHVTEDEVRLQEGAALCGNKYDLHFPTRLGLRCSPKSKKLNHQILPNSQEVRNTLLALKNELVLFYRNMTCTYYRIVIKYD